MLHHVDVHVRDLGPATALFDAISGRVGYRRLRAVPNEPDFVGYETADGGRPRIGFIGDLEARAGSMQLAFSVGGRREVDAVGRAVAAHGARAIEGPSFHLEYGDDYYAVFFEDADGNRYEVVARG